MTVSPGTYGIVTAGIQSLSLRLLDGSFAGRTVQAHNEMLGKMDLDKRFAVGDSLGRAVPGKRNHLPCRGPRPLSSDVEAILFGLFALLLRSPGWTGAKACCPLSFPAMSSGSR